LPGHADSPAGHIRIVLSEPGIASYTSIVQGIVNSLKSDLNIQNYSYVPFNQPDGEVYGTCGKGITHLSGLESDWITLCNAIHAIHPSAKIAGPDFYLYDASAYSHFMTYVVSRQLADRMADVLNALSQLL
jgi:hypothetical protein